MSMHFLSTSVILLIPWIMGQITLWWVFTNKCVGLMVCNNQVLCFQAAFWKETFSEKPPSWLLLTSPWPKSDQGPLPKGQGTDWFGRVSIWDCMISSRVSTSRTTRGLPLLFYKARLDVSHRMAGGIPAEQDMDPTYWTREGEAPH